LLDAVLRRGEPMDRAVHASCQRLPSDDRALAIAIAGDALRWLGPLDALIDSATDQILPEDSKVRAVLRIALVQLLQMRVAPHAVVATSLAMLIAGPRRLTHAILSRAHRDDWTLPVVPPLPAPVAERWTAHWGKEIVTAAEAAWAAPPPLDLRFRTAALAAAYADGASLSPKHRRLARAGRVELLPGYADGDWWVQDLAATIAADLLGQGEGRAVLDLCAAPGGKTMQLAAAGWQVTALDSSAKRLERLRENLARTRLDAQLVTTDLRHFTPDQHYDAVLLDAPCSATGTFRRHPDVLHRISQAEITALSALQHELLARSARWVRPGGSLIFATCSLEPAEGEAVIADFLRSHTDWRIDAARPDDVPAGVAIAPQGWVRTLPSTGSDAPDLDGFFIVRLVAPPT